MVVWASGVQREDLLPRLFALFEAHSELYRKGRVFFETDSASLSQ